MQYIESILMRMYAGKQALSGVAFVAALLTAALLVGCAVEDDSDAGLGLGNWEADEKSATSGDATAEESGDATAEEALSTSSADDAVIQANCSIVEYCNAPGADGSRCRQQGCSLQAALDECTVETSNVCGTPVCPWIFVALNGQRFIHDSCL